MAIASFDEGNAAMKSTSKETPSHFQHATVNRIEGAKKRLETPTIPEYSGLGIDKWSPTATRKTHRRKGIGSIEPRARALVPLKHDALPEYTRPTTSAIDETHHAETGTLSEPTHEVASSQFSSQPLTHHDDTDTISENMRILSDNLDAQLLELLIFQGEILQFRIGVVQAMLEFQSQTESIEDINSTTALPTPDQDSASTELLPDVIDDALGERWAPRCPLLWSNQVIDGTEATATAEPGKLLLSMHTIAEEANDEQDSSSSPRGQSSSVSSSTSRSPTIYPTMQSPNRPPSNTIPIPEPNYGRLAPDSTNRDRLAGLGYQQNDSRSHERIISGNMKWEVLGDSKVEDTTTIPLQSETQKSDTHR